jgi:hypothetical protein
MRQGSACAIHDVAVIDTATVVAQRSTDDQIIASSSRVGQLDANAIVRERCVAADSDPALRIGAALVHISQDEDIEGCGWAERLDRARL